jgi:16S rRNA (cytidine1402-2'-O)-methyltransferase
MTDAAVPVDLPAASARLRADLIGAAGVQIQDFPASALYVVATPIGNAADITVRALWVLAHVDCIAAEDTRTARPLLARYGIHTPLLAAHRHNEQAAASAVLTRLRAGARVAVVSDAGTPGVCDPGAVLVQAAQAAGFRVVPIAGASSVAAAVSAAGLSAPQFQFLGFAPTGAAARSRWLAAATATGMALVLLEAPHRIRALLAALKPLLAAERRVVIARELSKKFETITVHTAATLDPTQVEERGEFVVLVDATAPSALAALDPTTQRWLAALAAALPTAKAAAVAAQATGLARADLYAALLAQGAKG